MNIPPNDWSPRSSTIIYRGLKICRQKWKNTCHEHHSSLCGQTGLITGHTLDKLGSVFRQHSAIDSVLIYGSRAKGNYRPGSDIDLTIKGSTLEFAELMQIEDQIDDLYLPYTVDLSQYNQLTNPDLIAHIDRVGIVIYDRNAAREDLD